MDEASFVWVENGIVQPEQNKSRLSMLMLLGALDGAERFYSTECTGVVLTEDTDTGYLKALLEANGAKLNQILIHSYKSSSQLNAATLLASFINEVKPGVRVIIHRDRDFMLDEEVARFEAKFKHTGQRYDLFVTKFSDIEHYFSNPSHITAVTGISNSESEAIISDALNDFSLLFFDKFRSKREEIRNTLYSDDRGKCPSAIDLVVNQKVGFSQALGKS